MSQGDILRGVTLFVTKGGWGEGGGGGDAAATSFGVCLVVSRPRVVAHKKNITVVGIDKYKSDPPSTATTIEKVLDFMTGLRDGVAAPDVFYLGQIPG